MQLADIPSTSQERITAGLAVIPEVNNKEEFNAWLKTIKGKFVLSSMNQVTGRPEYNWEKFATPESFEKMKKDAELPATMKTYIEFINKYLGVPVKYVSNGPGRDQIVHL